MERRFRRALSRLLIPSSTRKDGSIRKGESTFRIMLLAVVSGFAVEAAAMTILFMVPGITDTQELIIDICLTVFVVFPTLFFILVRPLSISIMERERAEAELQKSREHYRAIVEDQTEFICRFSLDGSLTFMNKAFAVGFERQSPAFGADFYSTIRLPDPGSLKAALENLTPADPIFRSFLQQIPSDSGIDTWISWNFRALFAESVSVQEYQAVGHNITERLLIANELRKAYEELETRVSERTAELAQMLKQIRLLSTAVASTANGVMITDINGSITWVNPALTQITGYSAQELIGQKPSLLSSGRHDPLFYRNLWDTVLDGNVWRGEIVNRRKDNRLYIEEQTITPLLDENGQISHFIAVKQDVSDLRRADHENRRRNLKLQVLNKISGACSSSLDEEEVSAALSKILSEDIGVPGGAVYLYDEDDGSLCPISSWGLPEDDPVLFKCMRLEEFHCASAVQEKKVVNVDDFRELEGIKYTGLHFRRPHWNGYLCVPLIAHGRVQGVLDLFKNGASGIFSLEEDVSGGFSVPEVHFYNAVGNQVGIAIQNARLYRQERTARLLAENLQNASVVLTRTLNLDSVISTLLDLIEEMIPCDSAGVALLDGEDRFAVQARWCHPDPGESWEPFSASIDVFPQVARIFESKRFVLIEDALETKGWNWLPGGENVRSWLGIPLIASGDVIGFAVIEKNEPRFFTPVDIRAAEALAGQVAMAIQNAWLFNQVRNNHNVLQNLSRRLVEIQETERSYISRELHDEAGQALASILLGLDLLSRHAGDPNAVLAGVKEMETIVEDVLDNLHRMAMALRPASLDHLGLVVALKQYVESIGSKHDIAIQFEAVGVHERLEPEMETNTFRIVQEAVSNVILHAHATRLDILLEKRQDKFIAVVEDNGVGFDPQTAESTGRLGILGIKERAEMLGGKLLVESARGKGTTIMVEIPWENAGEPEKVTEGELV